MNKTVISMFCETAHKYPENICLKYRENKYTYRETNYKSDILAGFFLEKGIKKGDFIGIYLGKSEFLIFSILAIMKIGAIYVPLSQNYPTGRIQHIINDAEVRFILTDDRKNEKIDNLNNVEFINTEKFFKNEKTYSIEPVNLCVDDIAYLFYTSGSSGQPKGVLIHQAGFYNRILWQKNYFAMGQEEVCLLKAPIGFDISLWEIFLPIVSGAVLVIAEDEGYKDFSYLIALMERERVSVLQFVPSLLNIFMMKIKNMPMNSLVIKKVVSSGEELTAKYINNFLKIFKDCKLYNFYGPTETTICVTAKEYTSQHTYENVSLGKPIDNVNIYLLDNEKNIIEEDGIQGEIYISGTCVGKGYLNLLRESKESFLQNHIDSYPLLYRTGDMAKYIDGELVFIGRNDSTIKIDGNRVDLGEINSQISILPFIENAVVKMVDKGYGKQSIAVFYKLAEVPNIEEEKAISLITEHLKKNLVDYMIPQIYIKKDSFELTDNGKIDISKLNINLKTNIQKSYGKFNTIYNLFVKYTNNNDENMNFFEAGGSSIEALILIEKINQEYNVNLSITDLYGRMTVTKIIEIVKNKIEEENIC